MLYRVYKPANYNPEIKYPLVLGLHGAGGRGDDNKSRGVHALTVLSSPDVQRKYPTFLVTPQCPKNEKWATESPESTYSILEVPITKEMKLVLGILDSLQNEFSIDTDRLYVTGQSMGGAGTWDIILRNPNLFAAAVPVCGNNDSSQAKRIAHIPIWTFHGGKDKVVPTKTTRDMVAALKKEGSPVKYTEYSGVGHNSWIPAWSEKDLVPWLFKQRNNELESSENDDFGSLVKLPAKAVYRKEFDIEILPNELKRAEATSIDSATGDILINKDSGGFSWKGKIKTPGRYQVWLTYYCGDKTTAAKVKFNGGTKIKPLQYMGIETFKRFYLKDGTEIDATNVESSKEKLEPYYFREYWGAFDLKNDVSLQMGFANKEGSKLDVRVHKVELQKERQFNQKLEPLLFSGIDYYNYLTTPDGFVLNAYEVNKDIRDRSSVATCGVGLMAYSINHTLGRDPDAEKKALNTLRLFNNKHKSIQPQRHSTGFRHHFLDPRDASSRSEFSTIDTAILVCGALVARNTFNSSEVTQEADELWNSIDWSAAVHDIPGQKLHMTGKSIDGEENAITILYSEYILLSWLCQQYENHKGKNPRTVMPKLEDLSKSVYKGRVMLSGISGKMQPSFLVQFPFFMTNLCADELFFSYAAAQAWADRSTCISRYNSRTAWGVSAGTAPSKEGYSVNAFYDRNKDDVVTPRIIAGFIPTYPKAADDLNLLYQDKERHMETDFGVILSQWSPTHPDWQPKRLPGIDFSSWLFGMAAHHPKLGMKFFREKTKFTFNQD